MSQKFFFSHLYCSWHFSFPTIFPYSFLTSLVRFIYILQQKSHRHWSSSSSSVSQEKVDCITVNCEPVKAVIDDLIQKLFDMLLLSLRKSIQGKNRQHNCLCFYTLTTLKLYLYKVIKVIYTNHMLNISISFSVPIHFTFVFHSFGPMTSPCSYFLFPFLLPLCVPFPFCFQCTPRP